MSTANEPSPEERMLAELQRLYALRTGGGGVMIVLGAAVILGAGFFVTSVIWFILWNFAGDSYIGWTGWFFVYLIAIVPLLIREERRSQGSFFSDAAAGMSNPANAGSYGEYQLDRASAAGAAFSEMLLWGPRALLGGIATVRGQQPTRFKGLLVRASQILLQLYQSKEAMELKDLAHPGEPPAEFCQALKWLDQNDHIGLSSDGKRAWLSSKFRQQMATDGF